MTIKETISHLRKSPKDAWYYVQGNCRLAAYKNKWFVHLLRKHIIEQFEFRRDIAAADCYNAGSCNCCGCDVPGVFFASKGCSVAKFAHCREEGLKVCYGPLLSKRSWAQFKKYLKPRN